MSEEVEDIHAKYGVSQSYSLGDGLELWKVKLTVLQEQSLNARAQTPGTFLQLATTIEKQGRLESLPLCAITEKGLELISGHHRTRAARKANLEEVWVLVDVTGLSRDQIKAKQLAHNSIQGKDDPAILAQIFASIEDVESRIEAFIEPDMEALKVDVTLTTRQLDIALESKTVVILFLSAQQKVLKQALDALAVEPDEVLLATTEEYEMLVEALAATSAAYDIRSTPTLFAKMSEIVMAHIQESTAQKDKSGHVTG